MYYEDTTIDNNSVKHNEDTIIDNNSSNVDNQAAGQAAPDTSTSKTPNKGKRFAATATAAVVGGAAAAAGTYYMRNQDVEAEGADETEGGEAADTTAEPAESAGSNHAAGTHADGGNASGHHASPTVEPVAESVEQPVVDPKPEPTPEPTPEPATEPIPEPVPADVTVEPEVEILGVEVIPGEDGDMICGGVSIDGEEYVLIDVDGGDFDIAWYDNNQDQIIQETELVDISDVHINTEQFIAETQAQAQQNLPGNNTPGMTDEQQLASMDPMQPGEIGYMNEGDVSGLV